MVPLSAAPTYMLAILSYSILRTRGAHLILLIMFWLALHGSRPDQRPQLLAAFLPYWNGPGQAKPAPSSGN
jgi:hypothetical protein